MSIRTLDTSELTGDSAGASEASNAAAAGASDRGRYYRTDSRVSGVRAATLPGSLRVHHVAHDAFEGAATLVYDVDRRDHILTKVEAVPGVREVRRNLRMGYPANQGARARPLGNCNRHCTSYVTDKATSR